MARPGGRNARVRAAALDATLAELVEHGFAGLGIDAVAQRSGVGWATLYRRWGGHDGLVLDAVESLAAGHAEGHPARRGPRCTTGCWSWPNR